MQDKAMRSRATRTVKIGDNHHKLLRILADLLKVTQQEAFELSVEQTLTAYFDGETIPTVPFKQWQQEAIPAPNAGN